MDTEQVQALLLDKYGIRVAPEMSKYVLSQLKQSANAAIPVMGADARTGVPVRQVLDGRILLSGGAMAAV